MTEIDDVKEIIESGRNKDEDDDSIKENGSAWKRKARANAPRKDRGSVDQYLREKVSEGMIDTQCEKCKMGIR